MKLKIRKCICGMVIGTTFLASITGCGGSGAGNTFSYEDESMEAPVSTTVSGRVESIDGDTISLLVGGMGGRGGFGGGQRPDGEMPEGGEMPEMPEGGEMPEMPEGGEMPQRDMEQSTATLTISDEAVIKLMSMGNRGEQAEGEEPTQPESEQGSLADISEGSNLMISFDEDGNITEIVVMAGRGMKDKKAEN